MATSGDRQPEAATASTVDTQNTQYDKIGTKYASMADLPAVQPERPSVIAALGDIKGARCLDLACGLGRYAHLMHTLGASSVTGFDISTAMIDGAKATYPASNFPSINFAIADCSKPLPTDLESFDIIFAGWFLNYAGTEQELVNMFKIIKDNLKDNGKFIGITTNAHDTKVKEDKIDFYGLDVIVLDPAYVEPSGTKELGIKARVKSYTEHPIQFDVYQFNCHVYERCAEKAGLKLTWREPVLPDDGRKETGYWDRWLERPTYEVVTAVKI
ncbi:S-adenosyl-L-methionine-dependent methyltransferase [Lophiotrema nucula]|uniref:S-adenosyl-L-methionine-dependent methyltransferase n=1 Tax=Lophiotrema nucula TaxID=690887 RepID=A0A6A5YVF8_9PLEO|nr:S-adenosyl-L-methionine-dependent methyltransferase [Lophiotrema nucula]